MPSPKAHDVFCGLHSLIKPARTSVQTEPSSVAICPIYLSGVPLVSTSPTVSERCTGKQDWTFRFVHSQKETPLWRASFHRSNLPIAATQRSRCILGGGRLRSLAQHHGASGEYAQTQANYLWSKRPKYLDPDQSQHTSVGKNCIRMSELANSIASQCANPTQ